MERKKSLLGPLTGVPVTTANDKNSPQRITTKIVNGAPNRQLLTFYSTVSVDSSSVIRSLLLLDPILQFLTRATGQTLVPLASVIKTIPNISKKIPFDDLQALVVRYGVLQIQAIGNAGTGLHHHTDSSGNSINSDGCLFENNLVWQKDCKQQWENNHEDNNSCGKNYKDDVSSLSHINMKFHIGFPSGQGNHENNGNADKTLLCGSTKTAAKRRLAALKRRLKLTVNSHERNPGNNKHHHQSKTTSNNNNEEFLLNQESDTSTPSSTKNWNLPTTRRYDKDGLTYTKDDDLLDNVQEQQMQAQQALEQIMGLSTSLQQSSASSSSPPGQSRDRSGTQNDNDIPSLILPKQASYAGSHDAQTADYDDTLVLKHSIHDAVLEAFSLQTSVNGKHRRQLYKHQATAIQSALLGQHTLVCTGTGSGKSLCFWIPILQRAIVHNQKSMVLFPTKALAQDQLVKLQAILELHPRLSSEYNIRAATLDGDTPHAQRSLIAESCNIILTNPDTLHASILPNWKKLYHPLLRNLKFVVIDEAHMYEGVFGAHVAMILARLYRVHCCANSKATSLDMDDDDDNESTARRLVFLSCSATLAFPEHHFRLLCCLPESEPVTIVKKDSSPRASKHFFVWNPPLLDENGKSLGFVSWPNLKTKFDAKKPTGISLPGKRSSLDAKTSRPGDGLDLEKPCTDGREKNRIHRKDLRRRHSADETALLLARAVIQGVRCIAFCKTRCLVEWVYERCISVLKHSRSTEHLISKVDSYRGGYTQMKRREIEERLFNNQLVGVVGTSALELGVDIGGVEVTLHCGFPSSHASLLQQAGRAGRGAAAAGYRPSLAICICFNSPIDQHLWRHPSSLLARGLSAPLSMPIYPGLVQGHLLCAGDEFPLMGKMNVTAIQCIERSADRRLLADQDLFGSKEVYSEALHNLISQGKVGHEKLPIFGGQELVVYKTHPSTKHPWNEVSIRSIETVNYDIVDLSHPMQENRADGKHSEAAVLDNIPYSRVFYHAFPGAIITHRGQRYKIVSMTRPPAFGAATCSRTMTLGAYAKPSTPRYITRPLSTLKITVVKQMERVDLAVSADSNINTYMENGDSASSGATPSPSTTPSQNDVVPDASAIFLDAFDDSSGSFAGCGVVTVKRNVHGYKKLSLVTREELSRTELALPDMEYDTFAFWLDCDATGIGRAMTQEEFGHGIHALSHAICNVAPLFVPCVLNDVQCDHSVYNPTRVIICDARAGGSGICAQLWKNLFRPNGLIHAALDLLDDCPSCTNDRGYVGGCPACVQSGDCIKFNDFLCKKSALKIGRRMLGRMKRTKLYQQNEKIAAAAEKSLQDKFNLLEQENVDDDGFGTKKTNNIWTSPRQERRKRAMRFAKDLLSARKRQTVIGRPSWPLDQSSDGAPHRQQEA